MKYTQTRAGGKLFAPARESEFTEFGIWSDCQYPLLTSLVQRQTRVHTVQFFFFPSLN